MQTRLSNGGSQDYFSSGVVSSRFASSTSQLLENAATLNRTAGGTRSAMRSMEYATPPQPKITTARHPVQNTHARRGCERRRGSSV
jgi:hypothetical protein